MVLAEPLYGVSGNVLIPKGMALKAALIPRLRSWGVREVCIESDADDEETCKMQAVAVNKIPLETLFEGKMTTRAMQTVYNALSGYRA